jgi:hypothetical protein
MAFEEALRSRFLNDAPLASLVGKKVDWGERPPADDLPGITLTLISTPRERHLKGFQRLQFARVQVDCWGRTYAEARNVSEAAIAAAAPSAIVQGINFRAAEVDGPGDRGETTPDGLVPRRSFDLIIPYSIA